MSYQKTGFRIGGPLTLVVKSLIIINVIIFLAQEFAPTSYSEVFTVLFGLCPNTFISHHFYWQIFTYMFLHGGWAHILFNMLSLWMFGGDLEQKWGSRRFLFYYLTSGIGAGFFILLLNNFNAPDSNTIGASGAIYGLLLAYGITWPNREVLLYFLFPVKIKYLLIVFGLLEFYFTFSSLNSSDGNISHIGHVGGIITGLVLVMIYRRNSVTVHSSGNVLSRIMRKIRNRRKLKVINTRIHAKETIDRLLDKIASEGMASLTSSEKKELERARKNYYPGDNDIIH